VRSVATRGEPPRQVRRDPERGVVVRVVDLLELRRRVGAVDEHVDPGGDAAELEALAMEVGGVEVGETDRGALLDGERARVGGSAVAVEPAAREQLNAPPSEPVAVGEAEAALPVANDDVAGERAELVALEVEQVPVRVRRRTRVAEATRVPVRAHGAVRHPDELLRAHRAHRRRTAAAHPYRPVADVVGRRGEAELRAGDGEPERRALVEVRQQLARPDERRARVARLLPEGLARLERAEGDRAVMAESGRDLLSGAVGNRLWLAACRVYGPDVEAAAAERACGVREQAPVATPSWHRDDLVAAGQPLEAAAVAAHDVEARRAPAAVLPDEGDPAPVG